MLTKGSQAARSIPRGAPRPSILLPTSSIVGDVLRTRVVDDHWWEINGLRHVLRVIGPHLLAVQVAIGPVLNVLLATRMRQDLLRLLLLYLLLYH